MRRLLLGLLALPLAACAGTTSTPPADASTDQVAQDGSSADASSDGSALQDAALDAGSDASIPYEAGSLDQCNPNAPASCTVGKKCCSEPTHQNPPSAYVCVTPMGNGMCPLQP